jgi:hypothetical protein
MKIYWAPDYAALNPNMKAPTLVDGDHVGGALAGRAREVDMALSESIAAFFPCKRGRPRTARASLREHHVFAAHGDMRLKATS